MKNVLIILAVLAFGLGLTACSKSDNQSKTDSALSYPTSTNKEAGPAEKAGKQIDETMQKAGDSMKQAGDKAGEMMDKSKDKMKQGMDSAKEKAHKMMNGDSSNGQSTDSQ